ncbi:histidinol dehydrogenase [Candidatus Persebacteraceae bacterium Df01]|jgi:histidinol dehydrogenase|uniref:Histidinol dehydrogenase n=1 Tax=Candidatus Doriopsillibacter californiensis TaxID=2970740 RepID=A0ABT7QJQ5_9GAMM|nr:histidinol dehydrogenase [Candidatus Persebacteraceae bacterium Df01]
MIPQLRTSAPDFANSFAVLRRQLNDEDVSAVVANIIERVRADGDKALLELTVQYDRAPLESAKKLVVPAETLSQAHESLAPELQAALRAAAERIEEYHRRQLPQSWQYTDFNGNTCGERITPVARAAVYAPGGRAAYPSSVLMGVIPAKIAGVREITLLTPVADGAVPPITLAAAKIAGADKVFTLGGAQAVAAAALGTDTVPRADVIVGPGNAYVAEAKRQLCGIVGIDSLAGPSEVLIVCDDTANPEWVAADMLAQAEHDERAQCITVSPDAALLNQVAAALVRQLETAPRAAIARHSLVSRGALITAANIGECCQLANDIAAEHVQVMCADAPAVAANIHNAGGLFIGAYSCVPLGDYGAGPNHVLPTAQTARFASPLGVHHFIKRTGIFQATAAGARIPAADAVTLARAEGLFAHAEAAALRTKA